MLSGDLPAAVVVEATVRGAGSGNGRNAPISRLTKTMQDYTITKTKGNDGESEKMLVRFYDALRAGRGGGEGVRGG